MFSSAHRKVIRNASLRVEELESRQLLSVAVLPSHINVKTVKPSSHAVLTVQVLSDTTAGKNLINAQASSPLTFNVLDASGAVVRSLGQPTSMHSADLNGDNIADLLFTFRRSDLHGLAAGAYTLQATDGTAADTETAAFTLFTPGSRRHTPSHAHPGQGPAHGTGALGNEDHPPAALVHSAGLTTAASHNGSSQAANHSPVFQS